MEKLGVKRRSAGFTLTEVMVTVGILVVLLVLAFPVMSYFSLSLKMNELDAGARSIFVAAQNQMVALRASNDVSALSSAKTLTGAPSDFSGSNWSSLSYLSSADATQKDAIRKLLPDGAIDPSLKDGCYAIEFDPSTYRIYSVFYAKSDFTYNPSSMQRDRSSRENLNPKLGYYGGGVLEAAGNATSLSAPQITLTNNDELNISFTTANTFSGSVDDGNFFYGLKYTVMVSSATDSSKRVTFHDSQFSYDTLSLYTYKLTTPLDSLTGAHFKDVCSSVITPGDDIKITVIVSYSDEKRVTLPASTSIITNSLFAGRSNNEVVIAAARHLQNLEPTVSGVAGVTSAVQGANIDWAAAGTDKKFVPISNSALTSYNGNGLTISALNVAAVSGDSGLFGNFQGSTLNNIRIVNPKISGGAYSGALAGRCTGTNTTVSYCGVYITDVSKASSYTVSGTAHAGGLIGYTNTPILIADSFAAPYSVSGASSSIGGLIGYCVAGSSSHYIARSYADTDLISGSSPHAGGLIGHNSGTNVTDCYALGNISISSSSYIGGLAGYSVNSSYAASYAAATFSGSGGTSYGFCGSSASAGNAFASSNACLKSVDFTNGTPGGNVSPISYTSLINWSGGSSWTPAVSYTSHPYDASLIGKPYPFPHLKTSHHYNNWPISVSAAFAYYEVYGDGTYGYYALDNSGAELLNTLSGTKDAVVGDGYALITPSELTSLSFTYQNSSSGTASGNLINLGTASINSVAYSRYALPSEALNVKYAASTFYQYITINGTTYWYNPHFAKSAINGASSRPSFNGTVYMRSSRQFANLGNASHSVYWGSGFYILQENNINFDTYFSFVSSAIGIDSSLPFKGTYDGGGNTVTIKTSALKDSNSNTVLHAVFTYNSGTIKNLNVATSGSYSMGKWDNIQCAIFVGTNASQIQNCSVILGADVDMTTTSNCGVFVWSNPGTISNSLVTSSGAVTVTSLNGAASLAGFASSNSGTISSCYVRPGSSSYSALTLKAAKSAGFITSNSKTISGCSATAYVTEIWTDSSSCSAAGFVYTNGDNGVITNSYSNCVVKAYYAAGFAFSVGNTGALIQNCFSMVTVNSNKWGGRGSGFVDSAGSGFIKNCYAAAMVTGANSYTFSSTGTLGTNCRYYRWSRGGENSTGTASSLAALNSAYSSGVWGDAATHVYRDLFTDLPDSCPFPMIAGLDLYGDWCDPYSYMFSYFEKYSDNSYGYYVLQSDGTVLVDTLSDSKGALIDDGYMLLSRNTETNRTISGDTGGGTADDSLGTDIINISGTNLKYNRYFLPAYIINTGSCSPAFYMTVRIDNTVFYYNPHFAKAAFTDAISTPTFNGTVYIRSTRHFKNLADSNHSTYWGSNYRYFQQLDLDFTTYPYSIASLIGTGSSTPFSANYDGGNNTITINANAKSYRNALFGYNTGTIQNLKVATSGSFTMGDSSAGCALFVVTNTGTIQNCSVIFGADFGFSAGSSYGIFANANAGTITGCLVTNNASVTVSTNSGVNLGGFVYANSGTISYSRVLPGVTTYSSLTLKGKNTAGFVYNNIDGSVTYCSVTATVTVTSPTTTDHNAAGFVYTTNGGAISTCYSNCVVSAYNAAGFGYDCSNNSCTISYSYAMLKVSANTSDGTAAGFTTTGSSKMSDCYAATQVTGKTAYYFSKSAAGANCRYLSWSGNGNKLGGNTIASTLSELISSYASSPWGTANSYPYWDLYSVTAPCTFPLIAGLDHYGDWPLV